MRIISGIHKGRKIIAPKKLPVRPTTDMAKESLFNILHNSYAISDLYVLDLFAGTGNISYEFASRGAQQITAVDADPGCTRFIAQTAELLEMPIQTIKSEVFGYLEKAVGKFDIVFADPPYNLEQIKFERIITLVFDHNLLKENGSLIIEHSKHMSLAESKGFKESRNYGGSAFSIFGGTHDY